MVLRYQTPQGVVLWYRVVCPLLLYGGGSSALGLVLGLGLDRRMLGFVDCLLPSGVLLVRVCTGAAVAWMLREAEGPNDVIPWGQARLGMVPGSGFGQK